MKRTKNNQRLYIGIGTRPIFVKDLKLLTGNKKKYNNIKYCPSLLDNSKLTL